MLLTFSARPLFLVVKEVEEEEKEDDEVEEEEEEGEEEEEEEEDEKEAADKLPPINARYFFGKDSGNGALERNISAPNTGYALLSSSNHTVYLDPPSQTTTQPCNIFPDPCQFTKTR